ncbi:MAG TPA: DUF4845 domain-containing protein [Xanthomonadales bacterium]|nr:DUF4845 domain-containing protein [Xanthomonadales bacterium]
MKIRKQGGLTLIGFGFVLALGIFFAYTGMKVIPIYLEYNALLSALKTVENDPAAADLAPSQIRNRIINSLWVSYASDNIKRENIKISRSGGIKVRVVYEVRKSWIGNLDLLAHFDKTVVLRK